MFLAPFFSLNVLQGYQLCFVEICINLTGGLQMIFTNSDFAMLSSYLHTVYTADKSNSNATFGEECRKMREILNVIKFDKLSDYNNMFGQFYINKKTLERTFDELVSKNWEKCRTINFIKTSTIKYGTAKNCTILLANYLDNMFTSKIHWIQAFSKGKGVHTNALIHAKKDPKHIINYDLSDAFHQVSDYNVKKFAQKVLGFNRKEAWKFARITCYKGRLIQGSPMSPVLMNIFAILMDLRMLGIARKFNLTYTRYADDLTFSHSKYIPNSIKHFILKIITDSNWSVNPEKIKCFKNICQITGVNYHHGRKTLKTRARHLKMDYRALKHQMKKGHEYIKDKMSKDGNPITIKCVLSGIDAWDNPNFKRIDFLFTENLKSGLIRQGKLDRAKGWNKFKERRRKQEILNKLKRTSNEPFIVEHKTYYEQLSFFESIGTTGVQE